MTIVAANWVGENTSTLGTGPLALSGAISTFCPFSVFPDGSEVYYTLQEGFNRETGIGVVSNGTLTRNVQATLVAGVYTETDIPISLVGNGQVFAVINADFMTRIYNFSLNVADSVSAAAASAKAAAASADLANDYETQSAHNAEDAAASALSASDSKVSANASKNSAASSAAAAAGSQADSLASKNAAADSQADALASKNAAKTSETNSKASETASAQSATNASNSAAAALASQNAAKTSEDNAAVSRTGAGQSALAAKYSENAAKTSETNSKTSEANAKTSETNAASSATAAANSAALAQQYQPNTALQLFTTFVNAAAGNTMDSNLADGVYPVTADSPGAPLAVTGKVWVTHRGSNCQQTWESQAVAGNANYGRKFFRTGVDNGAGGITWGDWREHVFMDLNGITKVLRGVDSTFTLGADGTSAMHAVTKQQMDVELAKRSRFQQFTGDTRVVDPSGNRYLFVGDRTANNDWGVFDSINNAKVALPIASGGTGASSAASARAKLGVDYGTTAGTVTQGNDARLGTVNGKTGGVLSSGITPSVRITSVNGTLVNGGPLLQAEIKDQNNNSIFSQLFPELNNGNFSQTTLSNYDGGTNQNKFWQFRSDGNAYAINGGWVNSSDSRVKDKQEIIANPLETMRKFRGKTWIRKDSGEFGIGFIAQEVQSVFPDAVKVVASSYELPDGSVIENYLGLDTGSVSAGLHHEAILALMDRIEALEAKLAEK